MKYAVIGGTGLEEMGEGRNIFVKTPFGDVNLEVFEKDGQEIAFLSRHGKKHSIAPHKINYRANIYALKLLGVKYAYATAAVGSFNEDIKPGSLCILDDFIDLSHSRENTFFDGVAFPLKHLETSQIYNREMGERFEEKYGMKLQRAVYVNSQGPRFETASEIRLMKIVGADVVGMTGATEAALAREVGINYSSVAIVVNWSTGIEKEVKAEDIQRFMSDYKVRLTDVFLQVFKEGLDCDRPAVFL